MDFKNTCACFFLSLKKQSAWSMALTLVLMAGLFTGCDDLDDPVLCTKGRILRQSFERFARDTQSHIKKLQIQNLAAVRASCQSLSDQDALINKNYLDIIEHLVYRFESEKNHDLSATELETKTRNKILKSILVNYRSTYLEGVSRSYVLVCEKNGNEIEKNYGAHIRQMDPMLLAKEAYARYKLFFNYYEDRICEGSETLMEKKVK